MGLYFFAAGAGVRPSDVVYDRAGSAPPLGWTDRMKHSIMTLAWRYNADRMVADYVRHAYLPAAGGLLTVRAGRA